MSDETEIGSAGASDPPGHSGGSSGQQSPLQARAAFIKNWGWESIVSLTEERAQEEARSTALIQRLSGVPLQWEEKQQQSSLSPNS